MTSNSVYLPHASKTMRAAIADLRTPLEYEPRLREYRIPRRESESSQTLDFCPFCGAQLPPSLRDAYGDKLEALGLEFFEEPPEPFRSDRWWRNTDGGDPDDERP